MGTKISAPFFKSQCDLQNFLFSCIVFDVWFLEEALQQISMFLRSEPEWEVIEPLPDIGKNRSVLYTYFYRGL